MNIKRRKGEKFPRRLETLSPAAKAFLTWLKDSAPTHVVLNTSSNAHLYVHGAFVAYFTLGGPEKLGDLGCSPVTPKRLPNDVINASYLLMPGAFDALVNRHGGWVVGWATKHQTSGKRFLHDATPEDFFKDLREAIVALDPRG